MVLLAFSLQEQVEKYGAYVGIACFFGLAVLSLLYFAQAREVKRLREWAARAPELGGELERAIREFEERVRRTPAPRPVVVQAAPEPVEESNGEVKLKPAEVAALAFARAAGVRDPHEPKRQAVAAVAASTVAATALAPPPAAPAPAPASAAPAPAANGGGGGAVPPPPVPTPAPAPKPAAPAPLTPAARRVDPLPPRRPTPGARRVAAPPPRRESNVRAVVITLVVGVFVLAAAAYGATQLLGGDDGAAPEPNQVAPSTPLDEEATPAASPEPALTKETAKIVVYNGTDTADLARLFKDNLIADGSYPAENVGEPATAPPEHKRPTSVVLYRRGARTAASGVAETLDIAEVDQLDDTTRPLAEQGETAWDVVVIIGSDKSP